jgi:hypothetical protein
VKLVTLGSGYLRYNRDVESGACDGLGRLRPEASDNDRLVSPCGKTPTAFEALRDLDYAGASAERISQVLNRGTV